MIRSAATAPTRNPCITTGRPGQAWTAALNVATSVCLLLAGNGGAGCRSHDSTPSSASASVPSGIGPRITFDALDHDFGHVIAGRPMTHLFTVRNTGDAMLRIESASSSCTCTAAVLKSPEIPPGASGQVEVRITGNAAGPFHKQVSISSNDPRQRATTLSVTAVVHPDLDYEPHFIKLITDDAAYRRVSVWFVGDLALEARPRVVRFEGDETAAKRVTTRPLEELAAGKARRGFELSLKGKVSDSGSAMVIVDTGVAEPAQLAIPFSWGESTKLTAPRR